MALGGFARLLRVREFEVRGSKFGVQHKPSEYDCHSCNVTRYFVDGVTV
jgi:hypothetical protein